jgi:ParB family chromosome partitioning protein
MTKKSKGLGIGALLSTMNTNLEVEDKKELVNQLSTTVNEIPLSNIETNPYNPRVEFEPEALNELADSIRMHGLIQPITVRHLGGEKFQLISGERRLRASKIAGLESVPAYIRIADDDAMLELALIENIQRQDLNAIEIASTYERLMDELKLTHDTLSKRVGKKRSTVTNYLRLLKLPANIQAAIKEDSVSMGHARAMINIEDNGLVSLLCKEIIEKGISVRQVENYVKIINKSLPEVLNGLKTGMISFAHAEIIQGNPDIVVQLSVYKEIIKKNLSISDTGLLMDQFNEQKSNFQGTDKVKKLPTTYQRVQENLKTILSAKVQLKVDAKGKGQILINFENDDDLNRIIELVDK